jgi:hypothetical protein
VLLSNGFGVAAKKLELVLSIDDWVKKGKQMLLRHQ